MIRILSSPVIFSLELTSDCNGRCIGCSNIYSQRRGVRPPLSVQEWGRILEAIKSDVHKLRLTGGEPTLHPQFAEILDEVVARDLHFTLFTNALWSNPRRLVRLLAEFPNCDGLLISLHGADATAHEAFTQVPESFERVKGNIRRAANAGLSVVTSTVITRHNYQQIEAIATLSRELGADHATFSRYLGRALPALEPEAAQLREAVRCAEHLRDDGAKVRFGDCIPQCFTPSSSTGCLAGVAYCSIGPWGDLRPCTQSDIRCGNLLEVSLEEAWHSPAMQFWRSLVPPECETQCAAFSQCHGGCRATALIRGMEHDPLMTNPLSVGEVSATGTIELYAELRPVARFMRREEAFGYVLLGEGLTLASFNAEPLLDLCNGQTTLGEIAISYGQNGLALITDLWRHGLIDWAADD